MKDERRVLTREIIRDKLINEAKRAIVGCVWVMCLDLFVFGIGYLLFLIALSPSHPAMIIWAVAGSGMLIVCLVGIVKAVKLQRKAKQGSFTVVKKRLLDVEANKLNLWRYLIMLDVNLFLTKDNFYHVFIFEGGKTFIANSVEYQYTHVDTAANYSLAGDHFFIVYYNDTPDKIVLIFSDKMHQYQG